MRTSTKVLIVLSAVLLVAGVFLTPYLFSAIVPTGSGFVLSFSALSYVALAQQVLFGIFSTILFFRFLKTQRLSNVIFFSLAPMSVVYGGVLVYLVAVKNMTGVTAESVRATLNIQTDAQSHNDFLWAGIATIAYLVLVFAVVLFACRPLSRVQKATENLGDGKMKGEDFRVGGGKQFKEIENSLNKINYNYKEKENKIRQTNLQTQKNLPKQFFKFLGKNAVSELEMGNQVKKVATTLFCDLRSSQPTQSLSLEENFNYINSYIKVVAPLVRKFDGFIDKFLGDGVLAVFQKPQDAIECSHAIVRAIDVKNKGQKGMPKIDARICIHTGDVLFAVVGEEERKTPTIISDVMNLATKMEEINLFIGTKILLTKPALSALPQSYQFDHRYVGALTFEEGVQVALFESLSVHPKSKKEKLKKLSSKFEAGVRAYNEKNYQSAKEFFEYVLHYVPDDGVSYVYFDRASEKLKESLQQ